LTGQAWLRFRSSIRGFAYSVFSGQVSPRLSLRSSVRLLLIAALSFYFPSPGYFFTAGADAGIPADAENGMGGGVYPELDPELAGIPEPEEYSLPHMLSFSFYTLEEGDMIGKIAVRTGLNEDTLISVNNIKNTRLIQIGQVIRIPNQDGIYYTVKAGDTLSGIAERYDTTVSRINTVNELFSGTLRPDAVLFIPGAKMDWVNRQEINGELFLWPCSGYITSPYGYRENPFGGARQFHTGLDISAPTGSPLKAAMAGRVSQTGFDDTLGNYVVISHHSGYRTLYAHMSVVRVRTGAYVGSGERIGDVGATGHVTGPHVHFTVYKNGVTVNPRSLMR
jgi:murein DD-endopeptidase MepM/ murein hydrolase activator NlpD